MSCEGSRGGGIVHRFPAIGSLGQAYRLAELIYVSESRSTGFVVHLSGPSTLPSSGCQWIQMAYPAWRGWRDLAIRSTKSVNDEAHSCHRDIVALATGTVPELS